MLDVVSASDYAGVPGGWGIISRGEYDDLNKALKTGSGIVGEGTGGGDKLRVQSIENSIKVLTYKNEDLVLWKDIPKSPAYSTTEEYTRITKYGNAGDGWLEEVDTPSVLDQEYERKVALVKFLGVQKETSLVATLVRSQVSDIEAEQQKIGTLELLGLMENALLWGNSSCNTLSFDGIIKQIEDGGDADNIIDCEGKPLSEALLEQGAQVVADKYGRLDRLYTSFRAVSDLSKQLYPRTRLELPAPQNGRAGVPLTGFNSSCGAIDFKPSVFIKSSRGLLARTQGMTGSPNAATASTVTAANEATSKLAKGTTYYYWVSIMKNGKESAAYAAGNATTHASDLQKITVSLADAQFTAGTISGECVRIYRSDGVNAIASARWIADVPRKGGGDATAFVDINQVRPNTTVAVALDNDPDQVWRFRQLAPVMKLPLAITKTSKPFMLLIFGVPIVYNARKMIYYKNVGTEGIDDLNAI